jgi:tetratricopeptide (TPR) repeat protein
LDPSYGEAFHGLGVAHFQAKNYEKAIVCLKKALDLEPDLDEAIYFLGVAYLMRGENVPAYQCFMKYKSSPSYGLLSDPEKARLDSYIAKCKKD